MFKYAIQTKQTNAATAIIFIGEIQQKKVFCFGVRLKKKSLFRRIKQLKVNE